MSQVLSVQEIREAFLKFFEDKNHQRVASSRVVPENDPSLLFTNSGMVPFKDVFLGLEQRPYKRATSVQKCVRAGGKHNDLENVGFTARHHTFFEMLGNFSFGDYFKEQAIEYAWEFVSQVLSLPVDKLAVSVHVSDDEAAKIWKDKIGLKEDRIFRFDEDNFWAMGETGPCGTSSEIFWDQGRQVDGERWLEFWNLVFMQYDRNSEGVLTPLKMPSVDTGMGLERMATILQGVETNYDIDIFSKLIAFTKKYIQTKSDLELFNKENGENWQESAVRVIVDHLRAVSFMIADGVLPSNEGRGYVLRRILRRAMRFGQRLGLKEAFLVDLFPELQKEMGEAYPELIERADVILEVTRQEEERFLETLEKGLQILENSFSKLGKNRKLPASVSFQLYDSFGFPFDLTALIAKERGVEVNESEFNKLMGEQQSRSRESWKGSGQSKILPEILEWNTRGIHPKFTGYETSEEKKSTILAKSQQLEGFFWVSIDPCPFYGESGGQVGDQGELLQNSKRFEVVDCQKPYEGGLALLVKGAADELDLGKKCEAKVDVLRQNRIRAHHTATHLLHAALRKILGEHVHQAGSYVGPDRLRFDFSHGSAVTQKELENVEDEVLREIAKGVDLNILKDVPHSEAIAEGAMALFGEKYGDLVRVVKVPGFSTELCGGLHVKKTSELTPFKLVSESGVSAGTRRIEAVCSDAAVEMLLHSETLLHRVAKMLNCSAVEVEGRVSRLLNTQKKLEKDIENLNKKLVSSNENSEKVEELKFQKHPLKLHDLGSLDPKLLREKGDWLRQKEGECVHVILSGSSVLVTADPSKHKGFHAGNFLKELTQALGGKGGGQDRTAQGKLEKPEWKGIVEWIEKQ